MSGPTPKLDALADRLADLIVDRLADRMPENTSEREEPLIDAAEVARRFGVSRAYVYENAEDLGVVRLGNGERPRLRFDPQVVYERLAARPSPVATAPEGRLAQRNGGAAELLPIRGES